MMMILELPNNKQTIIDDEDESIISELTLYVGPNGYAYFTVWHDGKSESMTLHSLLCQVPSGMHVDHINGDKLDNRRSNLRAATPQENQVNRKNLNKNNTSRVRGVSRRRGAVRKPWLAQIMVDKENIYLGTFATKEQAIVARCRAELQYFGELCP